MESRNCMFDFENQDFFEIRDNYEGNTGVKSRLLAGKRKENCRVSVMIPTFLRNKFLEETLESACNQITDVDYEIVVVDNNDDFDDDDTLHVIEKYNDKRVSYYKNEKNLGMFGNWNRCIELALGDWVLILHDDDMIEADYIESMMKIVDKYPDAAAIGCDYYEIDSESKIISDNITLLHRVLNRLSKDKIYKINLRDMYYIHPINIMGCFINRKKSVEIGGFDDRWYPVSDYIFLLNMIYRGDAYCISRQMFRYRVAVNISYRMDHVIGCLEMDLLMRKSINVKVHILDDSADRNYRKITEAIREKSSFDRFGAKLSDEDRIKVQDEFSKFKSYCGFAEVTDCEYKKYRWFERWYIFKKKCISSRHVKL